MLGLGIPEESRRYPLPAGMPESERVRELERRVRDLEMENAFLKKAAAYFAREQR